MKVCQWKVGPDHIYENITKAKKKAGMLFSADFDRIRMNLMVYIKMSCQLRKFEFNVFSIIHLNAHNF